MQNRNDGLLSVVPFSLGRAFHKTLFPSDPLNHIFHDTTAVLLDGGCHANYNILKRVFKYVTMQWEVVYIKANGELQEDFITDMHIPLNPNRMVQRKLTAVGVPWTRIWKGRDLAVVFCHVNNGPVGLSFHSCSEGRFDLVKNEGKLREYEVGAQGGLLLLRVEVPMIFIRGQWGIPQEKLVLMPDVARPHYVMEKETLFSLVCMLSYFLSNRCHPNDVDRSYSEWVEYKPGMNAFRTPLAMDFQKNGIPGLLEEHWL